MPLALVMSSPAVVKEEVVTAMPSLSLYFPDEFPDPALAGVVRRLVVPRTDGDGDEYLIGRAPNLSLTVAVKTVSRRHCAISYSYAADRWAIQDLSSSGGTWLNSKRLEPFDWTPLAIGDRVHLSSNPPVSVVEDENDTINGDDHEPTTIVGTAPLDHRTGETLVTAPPPPKTYADTLDTGLRWLITPTTRLGALVRLLVISLAALVVVLVQGAL